MTRQPEAVIRIRKSAGHYGWNAAFRDLCARWRLCARSRRGPRQQHDLATEPASVDAGMHLARVCERQAVDDGGMDGAVAQQLEQCGHVGFELLRVRQPAGGDAVERRATAAEQ